MSDKLIIENDNIESAVKEQIIAKEQIIEKKKNLNAELEEIKL
jgi:hypothetical protein